MEPRERGPTASVSWPLVVAYSRPGRGSAILQHVRFHRGDIGNAADKSQEEYPEDRASPTGFLAGVQRARCSRGGRLIEFLFREFQIRFRLAGEEESPISKGFPTDVRFPTSAAIEHLPTERFESHVG